MKLLPRLILLALVAASLTGCVVRPLGWGHHYHGGGDRYGDRGGDRDYGRPPGPR